MLAPLVVLAIGSVAAGWVGVPAFMHGDNKFEHFLAPVMTTSGTVAGEGAAAAEHVAGGTAAEPKEGATPEGLLALASIGAAFAGLFFAWLFYLKSPGLPDKITSKVHGIYLTVLHKYYVDEGYGAIFVKPLLALSTVVFWRGVDQNIIDGLVNGAGETSKGIGNELRRMQSGNIRSYAAWVAVGGAAVLAYMIWLAVSK
jgi:NADH-quinone oxidoreductase subunit L